MSKLQGNYTLLLKTTLEALPVLVDVLEPFKTKYLCDIRKVRYYFYILIKNILYKLDYNFVK